MKMRLRRPGMLLLALLLLLATLPHAALAEEASRVRVGFYPTANYQEAREDGSYAGYSYDYYMQIQKYTRWEYEFVVASYADCLKMLVNGEIDLMCGLSKDSEREKTMLFSRYSVGSSQNKLYAPTDAEDLYYESYDTFDGSRIAIMRGTHSEELESYLALHGITAEIIRYDTPADMQAAIEAGDADMICASSVANALSMKIVAHMDKVPLYYAVSMQREDLLSELDEALRKIIDNNPNFSTEISQKYMISGSNATASFTREEMDYIRSGQKAYVIVNNAWPPVSWYDEQTDAFRGIFVDVIDRIHEYSGLEFVLCTEDEFNNEILPETPDAVNNVIAILADDNSWAVTQSVLMSNHVANASVVMVTKRSSHQTAETENLRVALPNRFYISWCLRNDFPAEQVTYYDTVAECLNAINTGKADVTYVNELVATYYLSRLEYSELFATANSGYSENLAFAVNKDSEQPLLSILDKSLLGIGEDALNRIVISNSISEQRASFRGLFYANPVLMVTLTLLFFLLMIGIVLMLLRQRARRRRAQEALNRDAEQRQARTDFFMMISHELRTPMNAVVGYLNLAVEAAPGNGAETEYLKRARIATGQLSRIAGDMLDYTRISSGSVSLREEVFDLKQVVRDLEQNLSLEAEKKDVRFQFRLHDLDREYVLGDSLRVQQIMQNLLSNAVKFTDAGGHVTAELSQKVLEDGNIELTFVAEDTGRGMSEDYLKNICAPFEQGDKAYSRTHGGLGLGLYLTKYYLSAMRGTMEVSSTLGEGSRFAVHFPLKPASSEQVVEQGVKLSHVRAMIGGLDDTENQRLKDTLKRLGVRCDVQTDAARLIRRVESRLNGEYAYSLVILSDDLLAEDADGILQQLSGLDGAPVIFAMADNPRSMAVLEQKAEITRVLYRPIFQSVLFNAVLAVFGAYQPESEPDAPKDELAGCRALVVEDNRINSDILIRILKRAGAEATLCENGRDAVERFEADAPGTYHVILMDIQMPVMNGYDATRAIRASAHPEGKSIPIIAVSANAFPEDIAQSLSCGMNEHISKPIQVRTLYSVLERYYAREQGKDELRK